MTGEDEAKYAESAAFSAPLSRATPLGMKRDAKKNNLNNGKVHNQWVNIQFNGS